MTELKKSLRLVDGLAMVVGITVGSGIFRTPGLVAARLGRPGLTFVAWILGAGLALLGALCFAELTTRQISSQAFQKTDSRPLIIKIAIRALF